MMDRQRSLPFGLDGDPGEPLSCPTTPSPTLKGNRRLAKVDKDNTKVSKFQMQEAQFDRMDSDREHHKIMGLKADKRLSPEVIGVCQRLEKSIESIDQIVTKLKQKVDEREK